LLGAYERWTTNDDPSLAMVPRFWRLMTWPVSSQRQLCKRAVEFCYPTAAAREQPSETRLTSAIHHSDKQK
jgi:hypothetical protein